MLRVPLHTVIALIGLIALLGNQSATFSSDPGTGWHLLSGSLILTTKSILRIDPFLALPIDLAQRTWICDQWLSDVVFAAWHHISGFHGLNLLITAVFVGTFFYLLYSHLRGARCRPIVSSLACLVAFKLAQVHFLLRPVPFSFLLFTIIWGIARNAAETGKVSRCTQLLTPLTFLLWANLHPSFLLGLLWLTLGVSIGCIKTCRCSLSSLALVVCAASATFINPFGVELHRSILSLTKSDYFMQMHQEWLPPNPYTSEGAFFYCVFMVATASLVLSRIMQIRIPLFDLISCGIAAWLSFRSIRTVPFFGIVAAPVLASGLESAAALCTSLVKSSTLRAAWFKLEAADTLKNAKVHALLLTLLLFVGSLIPGIAEWREVDPSPTGSRFPISHIKALKTAAEEEQRRYVVFAWPGMGGMISLYGYPSLFPVIDDRNTLLGETFYREYFNARRSEAAFEAFTKRLGVTHILIDDQDEFIVLLRSWSAVQLLRSEGGYSVFVTRS